MSFIITLRHSGSGELEFEEFVELAAKFLIEEDEEALKEELREAFRIYDKGGAWRRIFLGSIGVRERYMCEVKLKLGSFIHLYILLLPLPLFLILPPVHICLC